MLACCAHTRADHGANDQGATGLAAEHIAQLGSLVEDHIPADAEEVHKHQLDHRTQTRCGSSYRRPDEARFGNWRIQDALTAKLLHQPFSHAQHATPGIILLEVRNASAA